MKADTLLPGSHCRSIPMALSLGSTIGIHLVTQRGKLHSECWSRETRVGCRQSRRRKVKHSKKMCSPHKAARSKVAEANGGEKWLEGWGAWSWSETDWTVVVARCK